jgi:hypothetical protein
MAKVKYEKEIAALLVVDPYNEASSRVSGSFAASSTAARHSRFTGRIGGMGEKAGSGVSVTSPMFSVRAPACMKRL